MVRPSKSQRHVLARDVRFWAHLEPFGSPALTQTTLEPIVSSLRMGAALWDVLLSDTIPEAARDVFARGRDEHSGFVLPSEVVFPEEIYPISFRLARGDSRWSFDVEDEEQLRTLAAVVSGQWEDQEQGSDAHEIATTLVDDGVLVARESLGPPAVSFRDSGIYRLQHASLLFRTETTSVVTDPNFSYAVEHTWFKYPDHPPIDAVLVSHSHEDHFCLASLLQFPRTTTMIVPRVERASMLCPPMGRLLRAAGFERVIEAPWYSTHRIGDIEISVYPFFGEQPWLTFAAPAPQLRNCGNTYLVTAAGIKSWVLIDSGQEFGHAMREECGRVRDHHGEIDVVFSNVREFCWHPGQIDLSGRYLYCFPEEMLESPSQWPFNQVMTFGPDGIREFLDVMKPKSFLPYAHWWQPLDARETSHVVDGTQTEAQMLEAVRRSSRARNDLVTRLREWRVGDCLRFGSGEEIVSAAQPSPSLHSL